MDKRRSEKDHRPSHFRLDWTYFRSPHLALEADWWKSQLCKVKHEVICEYNTCNGIYGPTINDTFPKLVQIIEEQICIHETFGNLKLFCQFMLEYVGELHDQGENPYDPLDTPLHFASENNRLDILQILARNASYFSSNKMDLNFKAIYESEELVHHTVLGEACAENRLEIIEFYMSLRDIKLVDFNKRSNGWTLFHQACGSGHVEVVKLFLKHADELHIDLNARNQNEGTPFMMARSKDVLKLLLEDQRIDVNAMDDIGYTALMWFYNGPGGISDEMILELVEFLLQSPRIDTNTVGEESMLHIANNAEQVEIVFKAATKRYIDANRRDYSGLTPAHWAFGYDLGYENGLPKNTYKPVQLPFTIKKFNAKVEVFLKYAKHSCIDFEVADKKGRTPLHYMYQARSRSEVAQFLDAAKKEYNVVFNINALDHDGKTPVQLSEKM